MNTLQKGIEIKNETIEGLCIILSKVQIEALRSRNVDWSGTLEFLKKKKVKIEVNNYDWRSHEYGYFITMPNGDTLCPSYCQLKERYHDAMELAISVAFDALNKFYYTDYNA